MTPITIVEVHALLDRALCATCPHTWKSTTWTRGKVRVHLCEGIGGDHLGGVLVDQADGQVSIHALDSAGAYMDSATVTRANVSWAIARMVTSAMLDMVVAEVEALPEYAAIREGDPRQCEGGAG